MTKILHACTAMFVWNVRYVGNCGSSSEDGVGELTTVSSATNDCYKSMYSTASGYTYQGHCSLSLESYPLGTLPKPCNI